MDITSIVILRVTTFSIVSIKGVGDNRKSFAFVTDPFIFIGEIRANMHVLKEDYDQTGIRLQVRSGELELEHVKKMLQV